MVINNPLVFEFKTPFGGMRRARGPAGSLGGFVLLIALLVFALGPIRASASEVDDLLKEGDELFTQRTDIGKANSALDLYRRAFQVDPSRADAAARLSQALYWQGINLPDGAGRKVFQEAMEAAKAAVRLAPGSADNHYFYGVNMALYGQAKGIMSSLTLVDPVKAEMNAVLNLSPCYRSGAAHRVLGRMYFRLPGALGGSNQKAAEHLRLAWDCAPGNVLTSLYLADLHRDEGRMAEALKLVKAAVDGPCAQGDWPECQVVWKRDAKKILKKIEAEGLKP